MITKSKINRMMIESEILESALVDFTIGKKDINEVIECVHVFKKELETLMK